MGVADKLTLTYWDAPGRAEVARAALILGGVDFEDVRIQRSSWPSTLKATTPFGQIPILEQKGVTIAQSGAVDLYAAKVAGLYPSEAWPAGARSDQAYFFAREVLEVVQPTNRIQDPEEKKRTQAELAAGPIQDKLRSLTKLLDNTSSKYVAGDSVTLGDLGLFVTLSVLKGGQFSGVPTTILEDHPRVKEYHASIASLERLQKYYAARTEPAYHGFKI